MGESSAEDGPSLRFLKVRRKLTRRRESVKDSKKKQAILPEHSRTVDFSYRPGMFFSDSFVNASQERVCKPRVIVLRIHNAQINIHTVGALTARFPDGYG